MTKEEERKIKRICTEEYMKNLCIIADLYGPVSGDYNEVVEFVKHIAYIAGIEVKDSDLGIDEETL